jgi:hypothetical protein
MKFTQLNAVLLKAGDGILWLFKLNREMTGVVIDAQMFKEAWIIRMFALHPIEKVNDFTARLQQAERLRLQAQMHCPTGLLRHPSNVFNAMPEIFANAVQFFRDSDEFFEAAG